VIHLQIQLAFAIAGRQVEHCLWERLHPYDVSNPHYHLSKQNPSRTHRIRQFLDNLMSIKDIILPVLPRRLDVCSSTFARQCTRRFDHRLGQCELELVVIGVHRHLVPQLLQLQMNRE